MFYLKNLIKNEYFPAELPPCFDTKLLAENASSVLGWAKSSNIKSSIPYTFSGFKNENSRRKFAIPNPYHYVKTIDVIVDNSEDIFNIIDNSKISLSKPIKGKPQENQPYKKISNSISDTRKEIEKLYQDNSYQIKLDITSFFDSIYTHSIPWAMHTKAIAKKKTRRDELVGNAIDSSMQSMNHSQTNGILVGNAASRIISEIILCKIDKKIQEKFKEIQCKRFVDDYYIFLKDPYQIQSVISFIRQELGKYELLLNENKIQMLESPFIYGKSWVEEIKLYIHLDKVLFLNKVISLYLQYKDLSVLRYGITIISLHEFSKEEWDVMESKMINLWTKFPSLSDLIINLFIDNKANIRKLNMKNAINTILEKSISLNHHQEVIWAVWFAKVFSISINKNYLVEIIESKNSIAIILILDMLHNGICNKSKDVSLTLQDLKERLEDNQVMFTSDWLLAYEIDLNGWFNDSDNKFERARENDFFKRMIKKDIRFYNPNFKYEENKKNKKNMGYITRKEFYSHLKRIDDLMSKLNKNDNSTNKRERYLISERITKENKIIMEKISRVSDTY